MTGNDSTTEQRELLTPKQDRLIGLLLKGESVAAAAKEVGIAEKTAFRWLKDASFQKAYRDAQHTLFDQALSGLLLCINKAVSTLYRNLSGEDTPASTQVRAAQIVLEQAISLHKTQELEAKVAQLEDLIKQLTGNQ